MHTLSISRIAFAAADTASGSGKPSVAVKPRNVKLSKPANAKPGKPATKAANKPGKPAPRSASTSTVADADKRAEAATRRAADRATVAGFYAAYGNNASIPVKPVRGFKLETSTAHPIDRKPSQRQAAAVCVALAAAGAKLSDGAKAARCFDLNGVPSALENGVMRDAVSSGMLTVSGSSPEAETLTVTKSGAAFIRANIGEKTLKAAKLL